MRKEVRYTVQTEGRDFGKTYLITEFSAFKGEQWALKILFAIANAGIKIPHGIEKMGMEEIASIGFDVIVSALSNVTYDVAKPIIDEMMDGIQRVVDISHPELTRNLLPDDIEEISTILLLRREVWSINTSFLPAVSGLSLGGVQGQETVENI